jgi:hypothetical protein
MMVALIPVAFFSMTIVMPMVVVILPRMVMAISVAPAMLRPAPIAFPVAPALRAVLIVRDDPACVCIRRLHVMTNDPAVVVPLGRPESGHPHKGGFRRRRWRLDANRRRRYADIDGNLGPCWCQECCRKGPEGQTLFQHASLSERVNNPYR